MRARPPGKHSKQASGYNLAQKQITQKQKRLRTPSGVADGPSPRLTVSPSRTPHVDRPNSPDRSQQHLITRAKPMFMSDNNQSATTKLPSTAQIITAKGVHVNFNSTSRCPFNCHLDLPTHMPSLPWPHPTRPPSSGPTAQPSASPSSSS